MSNRYGHRDRGSKQKKAKSSAQKQKADSKRYKRHPQFGNIPIIKIRNTFNQEYWDYDPDYKPSLPIGAIRGNVRSQDFCRMCHVPKYYYQDIDKTCVQCGQDFIFSAKEQKYWYESLKFHFDSVAIRCPKCRKVRRSVKALNAQLDFTKSKLRKEPNDPSLLLSLAQTIIAFNERTGSGDLNEAIASCRKALKIWPPGLEAIYWEGKSHLQACRYNKASDRFAIFVEMADSKGKYSWLVRKAKLHINEITGQHSCVWDGEDHAAPNT